jgi:DUF1680 family protein
MLTRRSFLMSLPALRTSPVQSFPLSSVRLAPGRLLKSAEINRRYMLELPADRLLHMFRVTAGLPSNAAPLGGWEQPTNELRGHFVGHYLSACAQGWASLGDEDLKKRGDTLVAELARCQKALGNGYLSAFPEEFFDRLRDGKGVWAPWYTLHKIMAGLLDMHTLAGSAQALEVLLKMATWARRWVDPLGEAHMNRVLQTEFGGMNELFYNLHGVTKNDEHFRLGHAFDHERIFAPLAAGRDELKGMHANTNIPKIIGAARRYELSGERRYRAIAEYFWREITGQRCYCTGGTSDGESWPDEPGHLAEHLSGYTQECCCTYNMLKLTRHVFEWAPSAAAADYYERAFWNGILGTQHPDDGMTLYYVPLETGYWKLFGRKTEAFWCCTGSGLESFTKLAEGAYFHDEAGIWVNQFIASELNWAEKGLVLRQETAFPESDSTKLTVNVKSPVRMALRVRVPGWSKHGSAKLNGKPVEGFAAPGGYLVVEREWRDGETLEIKLPMGLRTEAMPDDDTLKAFLHGPIVLVGELGTEGLTEETLRAEPTKPRMIPEYKLKPVEAPKLIRGVEPIAGEPLHYLAKGAKKDVKLAPFYELIDQRYGVYWRFER